jgi:hypothetical protein
MTIPQFDDTPTENLGGGEKRDPSEFVPWDRIAEVVTPRGTRPGLVMIVRPLERIKDFRSKDPDDDWKTLVVADIAILDAIPPGADQFGMPLPPVAPGSQWRNQLVFPGMLNKAWRDKIGGTLIGLVYYGQATRMVNGTMGKPPFLWRSLSQDVQQVRRGQSFMAARPEFLIPIPRVNPAQNASTPDTWATPATPTQDTYVTAQADPWASASPQQGYASAAPAQNYAQPHYQQPPQQQYPPQDQWQHQPQPVQAAPAPQQQPPQGGYYQQPDPWASASPQQNYAPAPPAQNHAQQAQQQQPQQMMSTIEQMKAAAAARSAQGAPQAQEPPF